MDIAFIESEKGCAASLFEPCIVKLYRKENTLWKAFKEIPFKFESSEGIAAARKRVSELVEEMGVVRVIAGSVVSGMPYTVLDSAGFNIYEAEGTSQDILDWVLKEEIKEDSKSSQDIKEEFPAHPLPKGDDGIFSINLKSLKIQRPDVTSKQALLPFLRNEKFYELEVFCDHVPPWFKPEFEMLSLKADTEKLGENDYIVRVYHKTCNDLSCNSL